MRKTLIILFGALFCVASIGMAQNITSIYDVQYTTDSSGDSPLLDSTVTVRGIVTGESYAYGTGFYVQDSVGAWSGIWVYTGDLAEGEGVVGQGDSVTVTGVVAEYFDFTEIEATSVTVDQMWAGNIEPIDVSSGDIGTGGTMPEAYEGVLVRVSNAEITNPNHGFGEWSIDDGSGSVRVDDDADYYFWPEEYDSVKYVVGPLKYSFDDYKIEPRLANDVIGGGSHIRLQAIQQVRGSDLARIGNVSEDDTLDYSYYYNYDGSPLPGAEPYNVKGIVTMPTGLSYAGEGVKFIMQDHHGGPWSGILLYSPDSTTFPVLYEGDSVEVEGYVGEYVTSPSNMTEFWVAGEVNILGVGNDLPEVPHVNTGDLRWPTTAEQWGTVVVRVKDVTVTANDYLYQEWGVDDGTGEVRVDDDSDSLENFIRPPVGTAVDSIEGWVYHHFGSYGDSSTYKVEPLYTEDIVIGEGPPAIRNYSRTPGTPGASDQVTVTADLTDNSQVVSANVMYSVNGGAYQSAGMSLVSGVTWSGTVPAQNEGDWVDYFIQAEDDNSTSTTLPSDTSVFQYSYRVTDNLGIYDVQYTPWASGQSPYDGAQVTVVGIVTADTAFNNLFDAYVIQDPNETEWGGVFVFGVNQSLLLGQAVSITGTVSENNPDWDFKWGDNTVILASSADPGAEGSPLSAQVLTTSDLDANAEMYEGMLVRVNDAEVSAVNQYDWSITDDSGAEILIDDDASNIGAWFDSLEVGSQVGDIRGIWTYSFGTFKIELRDDNDHGTITGINEDRVQTPLAYSLSQNYPNPFNPETTVRYTIPKAEPVSIAIYNIRGQLVRTLLQNETMQPGEHAMQWNGMNNAGEQVGSGIYIYRIKAGDYIAAKKMTLLR